MRISNFSSGFCVFCAAVFAALPILPALATTVTPVVVDLQSSGRGVVANISVTNTGATTLPMEIEVISLVPTATGLEPGERVEDEDLLVTPPSVLIPAGQTQTFRVQWIGDPEQMESKHYYVSLNQLPVKLPDGESAVQVVYNFQVLVNVSSPEERAQLAIMSVSPGQLNDAPAAAVTFKNSGQAHGYISQHRMKVTATDAAGTEIFSKAISGSEFQQLAGYGLVASGQTRTINIPIENLPTSAQLSAVLLDERAK